MTMAESDRERWDRKYAAGEGPAHFEPKPFLTEHRHLLTGGRALDVACGFGGTALYLASLGYRVDAIDVSSVGLSQAEAEARRRNLRINFVQADLARWAVPPLHYDLITVFYYLNRAIMPGLVSGLRPGGLLFQATRNTRYLSVRPDFDPAFLLEVGELGRFAVKVGLDILHCADGTAGESHTSQLIALRPTV
jgi:2-polyprenyl-3-methyl-5-hydroxy-6-metoxy-1,4-benzoquinol methylase